MYRMFGVIWKVNMGDAQQDFLFGKDSLDQ